MLPACLPAPAPLQALKLLTLAVRQPPQAPAPGMVWPCTWQEPPAPHTVWPCTRQEPWRHTCPAQSGQSRAATRTGAEEAGAGGCAQLSNAQSLSAYVLGSRGDASRLPVVRGFETEVVAGAAERLRSIVAEHPAWLAGNCRRQVAAYRRALLCLGPGAAAPLDADLPALACMLVAAVARALREVLQQGCPLMCAFEALERLSTALNGSKRERLPRRSFAEERAGVLGTSLDELMRGSAAASNGAAVAAAADEQAEEQRRIWREARAVSAGGRSEAHGALRAVRGAAHRQPPISSSLRQDCCGVFCG